ncbi:MAG: M28 family metallopeptidase [Bacteroidales bacterium]|nr:M28 family metallopeptidase [Bacteroidales bacterium]
MKKRIKHFLQVLLSVILVWLVIFLTINIQSIKDLARFLIGNKNYAYLSNDLVPTDSEYKNLYDFVNLNRDLSVIPESYRSNEPSYNKILSPVDKINYNRMVFIMKCLDSLNIKYDTIWVPDRASRLPAYTCNIFIKENESNIFTIITAHYDNLNKPDYQGALDNSSSVAILLNTIQNCKDLLEVKNVAFLFTTMEEQGMFGAEHFLNYTKDHNFKINKVICLDGIGRGDLSAMNNCMGSFGFKFRNWCFKEKLFTGSSFKDCPDYSKVDKSLINLNKYNIKILHSFLSSTDGRVFIRAGIPTIHLTSNDIPHFLKVMHTNQDRIDGLHYRSLKQCEEIISDIVKNIE